MAVDGRRDPQLPAIGLELRTIPIESPQSNGMAEAFVRTIKRDYVRLSPRPNAETVMRKLSTWIEHYNEVHPHKAVGYRSPREFIATPKFPDLGAVVRERNSRYLVAREKPAS